MTDAITPTVWLSPAGFAKDRGVSRPAVMAWLKAGRLPDAVQLVDGTWQIPVDAEVVSPAAGVVELRPPAAGPATSTVQPVAAPTLAQRLDDLPAYLSLDVAAEQLGIPETAIRRNRDRFELEPLGERGALVMPQAVIRRIRRGPQ